MKGFIKLTQFFPAVAHSPELAAWVRTDMIEAIVAGDPRVGEKHSEIYFAGSILMVKEGTGVIFEEIDRTDSERGG